MGKRRLAVSRLERSAAERRARARAHLERVRRGGGRRARPAAGRLAWVLGSVPLGLVVGTPMLAAAVHRGELAAIHVRGSSGLAPEAVARASGVERGARLAGVDPERVVAQLSEEPWILRARAVRVPGGPLVIEIEERLPVAVVEAGGQAAFVDAAATPFAPVDREPEPGLPRLELAGDFALGEPDPRLAAALDLAYALPGHGLALPEVIGVTAPDDPEGYWLRLPDLAPRVVLGRDHPESRLAALARLLEAGRPEVAQAGSLDLRFADRAVLRAEPSQGGAEKAAESGGRRTPSTPGSTG